MLERGQLRLLQRLLDLDSLPGFPSITLQTNEIIRRGLTEANVGGWYLGVIQHVHAAGDDQATAIDPYSPGVDAVPPYPSEVPPGWDVWCLGVAAQRSAGAGGLTGAVLELGVPTVAQGWGRDQAGAPVVAVPVITLAEWDSVSTLTTNAAPLLGEQGVPWTSLRIRIPPGGSSLVIRSTSAAAATFQWTLVMGLFPEALGQDVVM